MKSNKLTQLIMTKTSGVLLLLLATLFGGGVANASPMLSGSCLVFVRKSNNEEIRTNFVLDFTKPLLAKKNIVVLPSGEVLNLTVSRGSQSGLVITAEAHDNGGLEIFSLISTGGISGPHPSNETYSNMLVYENSLDPNFVVINVRCQYSK